MKKYLLPHTARERGVALVLVLGALILVSAIIVGFLTTVRQDRTAAGYYESGSNARQYADTAISVAIAQIAEATSNPDEAWISQPGLLRTYNAAGPVAAYKLYSSNTMKTGAFNPETALGDEIPTGAAGWYTRPHEFVDLNRPVQVNAASTVYPIVDPGAVTPLVEGFSFALPPGLQSTLPGANALPMPVRWIYVLKDGSLVDYATAAGSNEVTSRIAFWGDDETSKVNINTASDGVYFDAPSFNTKEDHWMAFTQPIAQEYQRFPGHPATTSLSAVFQNLRNIPEDDLTFGTTFGTGFTFGPALRSIEATEITPRISSRAFDAVSNTGGSNGSRSMGWTNVNGILPDSDRLFASVDELLFKRDLASKNWTSGVAETSARYSNAAVNPQAFKFFLTTDSRAPELTILNRPRVTLWPFNADLVLNPAGLTPEDRLIKMASEFGTNQRKLYFQRDNAWDPSNDYANILANTDLYGYLQWATGQAMPSANPVRAGGANTLQSKYSPIGRDQILTEMFDYVRGNVNTTNYGYRPVGGSVYGFPQSYASSPATSHLPENDGQGRMRVGYNDITPLRFDAGNGVTKGLNSVIISEILFQFYNAGEYLEGQAMAEAPYGEVTGTPINTKTFHPTTGVVTNVPDDKPDYVIRRVQLVCLLNLFGTKDSPSIFGQRFQVKITGNSFSLTVPTDPSAVPGAAPVEVRVRAGSVWGSWGSTVSIGFPAPLGMLRDTFVSGEAGADFGVRDTVLGLSAPMTYPSSNGLGNPIQASHAKTLTSVLGPGRYKDNAVIDSQKAPFQTYPFLSNMVEFKIPIYKTSITAATSLMSPFPITSPPSKESSDTSDPSPTSIKKLKASFGGSPNFSVTVYPGLMKNSVYPDINQTGVSLHDLNTATPLTSTEFLVENALIPLPRLGPETALASEGYESYPNDETASNQWPPVAAQFPSTPPSTRVPTLKELQYYPARFRQKYKDYLVSVPRSHPPTSGSGGPVAVNENFDVIRSYHLKGDGRSYGDFRLAGYRPEIPNTWWERSPGYFNSDQYVASTLMFRGSGGYQQKIDNGRLLADRSFTTLVRNVPGTVNGVQRVSATGGQQVGDFTTGYGSFSGGAAVLGPDVGSAGGTTPNSTGPYFNIGVSNASSDDTGGSFQNTYGITFSPFKQIPSPVMFGTLPSRALQEPPAPWETLLFCPNPAGGQATHRGWDISPRDHYFLDLFYMPVVEPYAITENYATNGKINLNYQIAPFTYIQRKTGIHALLRNLKIAAVANSDTGTFKPADEYGKFEGATPSSYRLKINVPETLIGFDDRFTANDPFVSASEICEMFLVPVGQSYGGGGATIKNFWHAGGADNIKDLTGDDKKESPYNALYPRVTTRSNSFKVHFIAQTLKGKPGQWAVAGQYRGSQIIERYLDGFSGGTNARRVFGSGTSPDTLFPALAGNSVTDGQSYYRFRKLKMEQFAP